MPRGGGIQGPLEERRWDVSRAAQLAPKPTRVSGRVLVVGSGEATVSVKFPVRFLEEPIMNFGWVLGENQSLESGNFPFVSVGAFNWQRTEKMQNANVGYTYHGCSLAIALTGQEEQQVWVHWTATGRAFRNPDTATEQSNETV